MAEPMEESLLSLLDRFKDRLPGDDFTRVRELVEHREWGIGLQDLCTQLHEHSVPIAPAEVLAIKQLAAEMCLSVDTRSFLEPHAVRSFFTLMDLIEKRPGMYVGYSNAQRDEQLRGLELLIVGYGLAVQLHGVHDSGVEAYSGFADYLRDRFGWSMSCGPLAAIRQASDSSDDAWSSFWRLLSEFRASVETGTQSEGAGRLGVAR